MGDPVQINKFATFMNEVVAAVVKGGRTGGEAYIIANEPFLEAPFFKWILDEGLDWLCSFIDHNVEMILTGLIIDIQTNREKSAVYRTLSNLADTGAINDPKAKEKAIDDAKTAWGDAIHWDGIADDGFSN